MRVKDIETQLVERENELQQLTQIKDTILEACHPNALPVIKQSFLVLEAAWHRVRFFILIHLTKR